MCGMAQKAQRWSHPSLILRKETWGVSVARMRSGRSMLCTMPSPMCPRARNSGTRRDISAIPRKRSTSGISRCRSSR